MRKDIYILWMYRKDKTTGPPLAVTADVETARNLVKEYRRAYLGCGTLMVTRMADGGVGSVTMPTETFLGITE